MTTYKITPAHSGTEEKEIAKAKRHFRKMKKERNVYSDLTHEINIRFSDVNYCITADFVNEFGQEVCPSCTITDNSF